ncbi:UDP-N-acetylglucosamine--LPS N-acetylglucosamine transferase [Nodularia spumigena CS-591/12]|uniref:UDP-N-acetylglucosamine--LPS N-acetylglucosamine transferase n=1 Tax=Nodularia spumigena TaxID=70799 RepID=UPI00232B2216|nr:UDP-N-acetylglucosamine--LPS N-acetylglucosamine transferase [Nodularia spumigena]MDB9306198.1 UDP-N-acetylglucosamine--LPS N-acetylglucosamine transferase [Nodularia spumigena CS-591/12]
MKKTWLIYALGGGWGHLTRALSLGRIAARYRKIRIITNSPYAQEVSHEGCLLHWIPDNAGFSATCIKVREILLNTHYDCLIVDTFPRGLGGELADILPQLHSIPRILIHRDINPNYITAKNLRSFVVKNFDAVIVPGEGNDLGLCDLPGVHYTTPWLIRNAEELPERNTTRSHILRVDKSVKIILVCAAGQASELDIFSQITLRLHQDFPQCAVRILAPHCPVNCPETLWISHHPGIECLAAADVVIGGGGYNTVYECAAVGVPLVALAFARLYDRQEKRARQGYYVPDIEQAIATVRILLDQVKIAQKQTASAYINGAVQAMYQIMSYKL